MKNFFQSISGGKALEVMPCGGKKAISPQWDAFENNDKICSPKGGLSPCEVNALYVFYKKLGSGHSTKSYLI